MKQLRALFLALAMIATYSISAQVAINTDGADPDDSAILDVKSTDKCFLPPRMTQEQKKGISSPVAGSIIYQTDETPGYYYYTGSDWIGLVGKGAGAISTSDLIDVDGNTYPSIAIGDQLWMAENLRVTHYRNGDSIPNVAANQAWEGLSTGAYCWYGNKQANYEKYGALYNWYTVNDKRGLCPRGWHVPTDAEWTILTDYLGKKSGAGGQMKATSNLWKSLNTGANNSSGFAGHPGGFREAMGKFFYIGSDGTWWSSSGGSSYGAWDRTLSYRNGDVNVDYNNRQDGSRVRCLRD